MCDEEPWHFLYRKIYIDTSLSAQRLDPAKSILALIYSFAQIQPNLNLQCRNVSFLLHIR